MEQANLQKQESFKTKEVLKSENMINKGGIHMFNLNEAFKEGYEQYLREEAENNFVDAFEALEESQKEAEKSFEIIRNYFDLYALSEGLLEVEGLEPQSVIEKREKKDKDVLLSGSYDSIKNLIGLLGDTEKRADYTPAIGNVTLQKITEMRFPQNIIFFLQSLISWLTNLVRKFISFFTNGVQRLFGLEPAKDFSGDLKLNLAKAKAIESIAMPVSYSKSATPKAATAVSFDMSAVEKVRDLFNFRINESVLNEYEDNVETENKKEKQLIGLKIDISKDMENLHQQLVHFLDLFDNAYGSNQEHLFETEDLQLLLELFKATMEAIAEGRVPTFALQGKLTELETINKDRLKDNLIRTKINTENLKKAYIDTQQKIISTLQIISQKQLFAAEGLGVSFRFYSAATYVQMEKILDVLNPRIKDAERLEKRLTKMGQIFDKVIIELGKQRSSIANFGPVTYTSVYQRKVNDLFDASRYVSQTITLRMATLGLYIRQLKDVKEAISNANSINARSKDYLKKSVFSGVRSGLFR
jgi:hypothetical protein